MDAVFFDDRFKTIHISCLKSPKWGPHNIHHWKKVELCNSLFERWEVAEVFLFSLAHELGSCAARRAARALG